MNVDVIMILILLVACLFSDDKVNNYKFYNVITEN